MNLLAETLNDLKANAKTVDQVSWCGSSDFGWFTWEEFAEVADVEYDAGFGSQEVCRDLLVVGDNWWLERAEYDGSECWVFKTMPSMPSEWRKPDVVADPEFMWVTLTEVNK